MPSEAISYFKTHLCWFYILGLPDNNFIKKVQRLIYNFWGKPKELSGLYRLLIKALKAAWVSRLFRTKDILYKILDGFCKELNINIHYVLQITNIGRLTKLPKFYQEILFAFNECKINPGKM